MADGDIDDFVTPYGCSTFALGREVAKKKKRENLHVCAECQDSFVSRQALVTHMENCLTEAFHTEVQREIPEVGEFSQDVTKGREKVVARFTAHMFGKKRAFSRPGADFGLNVVPHEVMLSVPGLKTHRIQPGEPMEKEYETEEVEPPLWEPETKKKKRPVVGDTLFSFPYPAPFPYPEKPEVVVKATMKVKCPDCNRELLPKNFKEHYRIHTGEQPYACYFCDKSFRTSRLRIAHVKTHDPRRPCECNQCDFKCTTSAAMDKHMKEEHRDRAHARRHHSPAPSEYDVVFLPPPVPSPNSNFPMTSEQQEDDSAVNSLYIDGGLLDDDMTFDELFGGDYGVGTVDDENLQQPIDFNLKHNHNDVFLEDEIYIDNDDQYVPF